MTTGDEGDWQCKASASLKGARILVVEARYYEQLSPMRSSPGAIGALDEAGASHDRLTVPGALEIPTALAIALDAARRGRSPMTERSRSDA